MSSTSMKPMLAKDADPAKLRFPLVAQPKYDGIRALVVDGVLVSRSLKPIPNAEIQAALGRPEFNGLDGELIVGEPTAADNFQRTTSFVRGAAKTGEPWAFWVFDKFNAAGGFWARYSEAEAAVRFTVWDDVPLFMVPTRTIQDADELRTYEMNMLTAGYEGVMVRDPAKPYKFGRSYPKDGTLLKVKRFVDFEAEVIGVYEQMHNGNEATTNALGRTERSSAAAGKTGMGVLGGFELRALNGPWAGATFRCGTGFDAATRAALWLRRHDESYAPDGAPNGLVGRIAKVKAQDLGAKDKPRFPVFLGWREDFDR